MIKHYDQTIFDLSKAGRIGYFLPDTNIDYEMILDDMPKDMLRKSPLNLPEVSENMVVRHYTNLSNKNYGVDTGMYPLGSCTMKYNPKINETVAGLEGFYNQHPSWPLSKLQGSLSMLYDLQNYLKEITGMHAISLEPSAGSQGELTGLMIIKKYHELTGNGHKYKIIIPDSAHGTNPASVNMAGYEVVELPSNNLGKIDLVALEGVLDLDVAGLMLTNPNTLGIFETDIKRISEMVHQVGGLLYYAGANMNANLGITRPSDMGFDIVHLNLHKTFSTPHGGGGPGSGPVGVVEKLAEYLPTPIISKDHSGYNFEEPKHTIGKIKQYYGNFSILLRAYTYILTMGYDGLKNASKLAVLNANYMLSRLKNHYRQPYPGYCKHEFVLSGLIPTDKSADMTLDKTEDMHIRTYDVAKRLIDLGVHPPTIYFPLIVEQALMIEPTESESKESIDNYIDILLQIADEAVKEPALLLDAPINAPVRRLDEVSAARRPILRYDAKRSPHE